MGANQTCRYVAGTANSLQHISWADIFLFESTNKDPDEPALLTSLIGCDLAILGREDFDVCPESS